MTPNNSNISVLEILMVVGGIIGFIVLVLQLQPKKEPFFHSNSQEPIKTYNCINNSCVVAAEGTIGDFTTPASCQKYCKVTNNWNWFYSTPYVFRHPAIRYRRPYYGGWGYPYPYGMGHRYRRRARREARRQRRLEGKHDSGTTV